MTAKEKIIKILDEMGYIAKDVETIKNGQKICGLALKSKDQEKTNYGPFVVCPTVYLNYENLALKTKEEIIKTITEILNEGKIVPDNVISVLKNFNEGNWDLVKDYIDIVLLQSPESNSSENNLIYRQYLDLFEVLHFNTENYSIRIDKDMLKHFDITEEDIWLQAENNIKRKSVCLTNIVPVYSKSGFPLGIQMIEHKYVPRKTKETKLFLSETNNEQFQLMLTSLDNRYGAFNLKNMDLLKFISENLSEQFFIIPSSIHEIIITPYEKEKINEIRQLICEVNQKKVMPEERLSNNLYMFDGKQVVIVE